MKHQDNYAVGIPVNAEDMLVSNNCKYCGNAQSPDAIFCNICGQSDALKNICFKCKKDVGARAVFC